MSASPNLRLYLDTANTEACRAWMPTGLFYGVTTNPLLFEHAQVKCNLPTLKQLAQEAFDLGAKEMQLQTWGDTVEDLVITGKQLAALDPRVVDRSGARGRLCPLIWDELTTLAGMGERLWLTCNRR